MADEEARYWRESAERKRQKIFELDREISRLKAELDEATDFRFIYASSKPSKTRSTK